MRTLPSAQKVIFTALLLAQLAPASTVTDEPGLAEAVELLVALALGDVAAAGVEDGVEEVLPLLHAARPVTAARAAIPPSAIWGRAATRSGRRRWAPRRP
jgi:hypothetical protein